MGCTLIRVYSSSTTNKRWSGRATYGAPETFMSPIARASLPRSLQSVWRMR